MINGAGLAPLSIRAIAKLVDAIVFIPLFCVAVLTSVVSLGGALVSYSHAESAQRRASEWLGPAAASAGLGIVAVAAWIGVSLVTLYQWHLLISAGQTIGKRFCGIRIVGLDAQPAGFFRALLLRNWVFIALVSLLGGFLSLLIPPAVSLILLLDWALALNGDRRCLHDHLAGTQVRWVKAFEVHTNRVAGALVLVSAAGLGVLGFSQRVELERWLERGRAVQPATPVAAVPPGVVAPEPLEPEPVAVPAPAPEVAYDRFTDGDGVTHVVDTLEQVPPRFRNSATVMKP